MRSAFLLFAVTVACALALPPPRLAGAQSPEASARARVRFNAGVSLYDRGNYAAALDAFREAYRLRPHPAVLANIANCYLRLDRPREAVQSFERHLRESEDLPPERRAEIEVELGRARGAIAHLAVGASGPGILIFVDGDRAGYAPMRFDIDPGPHVIELRAGDGSVRTERVRLAPGATQTIDVGGAARAAPEPDPSIASGGTTSPMPSPSPSTSTSTSNADADADANANADANAAFRVPVAAWVTGGLAVATLGLGVAFGLTAVAQKSEFDDLAADIERRRPGDPDLPRLQDDARSVSDAQASNALVADVMFVAALASAGLCAYFVVRESSAQASSPTERFSASLTGAPAPGGGTLLLRGAF